MNVFVLGTGRCGSTTFIEACRHIANYSAGHESRAKLVGQQRLAYPANHIEADNRLSWFLGRLDRCYGNRAFYVHLLRDREETINSFTRRSGYGIMKAYREGILMGGGEASDSSEMAADYIETVDSNIGLFLRDKHHWMPFELARAAEQFEAFWRRIGAVGDLEQALAQWRIRYNASAG